MKFVRTIFARYPSTLAFSQTSKPVTVPITLDHNRIVIDVYLPLPDGTSKRVRAWVDTGSSDMTMSQRVAALFGPVHCDGKSCTATPPPGNAHRRHEVFSVATCISPHVPAGVPNDFMVPGMSPEITSARRRSCATYDVVVDYANRQFTIGEPGSVQFSGKPTKAQIESPRADPDIAVRFEGETHKLGSRHRRLDQLYRQ